MSALVIPCRTPGCSGRAEFSKVKKVYICHDCRISFSSEEVASTSLGEQGYRFHGRLYELSAIRDALEKARDGRPQVVLLHGEPGIGKSALMRALYRDLADAESDPNNYWPDIAGELSRLSDPDLTLLDSRRGKQLPYLWLAGRCSSPQNSGGLPLEPWIRAVEGLRNIPLNNSGAGVARQVAGTLASYGLNLGADLIGLGFFKTSLEAGVEIFQTIRGTREQSEVISLLSPQSARTMNGDLVGVVRRLAQHRDIPLLVIALDDLQWADEESCSALTGLISYACKDWHLLLILGYRDNEVAAGQCAFAKSIPVLHRNAGDSESYDLTDLTVATLDKAAAEALVRDHFPDPDPGLLRWLVNEIGGKPFYLHQFCLMLKDRSDVSPEGSILVKEGIAGLQRLVTDGHLPIQLEKVLEERFNRLNEYQRDLLAYGSVEGRCFTDLFLERVLDRVAGPKKVSRETIRRNLQDCEHFHRLINAAREESPQGWPYEFRHDLLHAQAGRMLSAPMRQTCSDILRDWLLEQWRSKDFDALPVMERYRLLSRLIELLPKEAGGASGVKPEELTQLYINAARVSLRTVGVSAALKIFQPIIPLAENQTVVLPARTRASCYRLLGDLMRRKGNLPSAAKFYHQALASGQDMAPDKNDAQAQSDLSLLYLRLGELMFQQKKWPAAEDFFLKALSIRENLTDAKNNVQVQRHLSISYARLGDLKLRQDNLPATEKFYSDAFAIRKRLAVEADNAESQRDLSSIHDRLGNLRLRQGSLPEAEESYLEALAIRKHLTTDGNDTQAQRDLSASYRNLGALKLRQDYLSDAEDYYRQSLAVSQCQAVDGNDALAQEDLAASLWALAATLVKSESRAEASALCGKLEALLSILENRGIDSWRERAAGLRRSILGLPSTHCQATPEPFTEGDDIP